MLVEADVRHACSRSRAAARPIPGAAALPGRARATPRDTAPPPSPRRVSRARGRCGSARTKLLDGCVAAVAPDRAAEQVVEDAEAQRAADRVDSLDAKLRHRGRHDREAAGEHRRALRLDALELQPRDAPGADHPLAQPGEALGRDAARRKAVLLENGGERQRRPRRRVRFAASARGRTRAAIASISARASVSAARNASARSSPRQRSAATC